MDWLSDHASAVAGVIALVLAALAWWGDHRRLHRRDPDRIGIIPWTGLFFWSVLAAAILLAAASQQWLAR